MTDPWRKASESVKPLLNLRQATDRMRGHHALLALALLLLGGCDGPSGFAVGWLFGLSAGLSIGRVL